MADVDENRVPPDCCDLLKLVGEDRLFFARRHAPRWLLVNTLGAEILHLCNGRRSLHEITELIRTRYDRPSAEIERDVAAFWSEVRTSQLLAEWSAPAKRPSEVKLESPELHVTTRCNQSCAHCGVRGAFPEGDMAPEVFREVVKQSVALGASRIILTGGEPLIRNDFLDLLRSVEGIIPLKVLTNGTLLDAAKARELARLQVAVQVSLDGGSREVHDSIRGEGAFDSALRGVRLLRDCGVSDLSVNFTIQQGNARDVSNLLRLAECEGVGKLSLIPLAPGVEGDKRMQCADLNSILAAQRQVERRDALVGASVLVMGMGRDSIRGQPWCVPGRSPCIGPDGSVFPCPGFVDTPYVLGTIPDDTLEQAIGSKPLQDLRRVCRERVDRIEECSSCVWKHFCRAGCAAFAYHQQGTVLVKDCFCETRKRLYADLFLRGEDNADCPAE